MLESPPNDGNLPERVGQAFLLEASDKTNPPANADSSAVAALQEEVIRLRQEKPKSLKKGSIDDSSSLTGRVDDYQSLITSLTSSGEGFNKTAAAETTKTAKNDLMDDQASLIASMSGSAPISMSQQPELALGEKTNIKTEPAAIEDALVVEHKITKPPVNTLADSSDLGDMIALQKPNISNTRASDTIQIASNTPTFDPILSTGTRPKYTPESTIAKAPDTLATTTNTEKITFDPILAPANASASRNNIVATNTTESPLSSSRTLASTNESTPIVAFDNTAGQTRNASPVAPLVNAQSTSSESRTIATTTSQTQAGQTTAEKATAPQQIAYTPEKSQTASFDQQNRQQQQDKLASASTQDKPALQSQSFAERPNFVASSTSVTSGIASAGATIDNPLQIKDNKDLVKDNQLASAINYPKYGGAPTVEESAKPVIQQQKPQSFQSSLARDTASEKAHSLSESFVSGKVLNQQGKEAQTKESPIEAKSADSKTNLSGTTGAATKSTEWKSLDSKSDSKSPDIKTIDAKTSDVKFTDAKIPEGRASDPRSIDLRGGHEIPGANSPLNQLGQSLAGDRIPMAAGQPGKQSENQPSGKDGSIKAESTTKSDGNSSEIPDKSGKKQDADDKKDIQAGKGPGNATDTGKIQPGSKAFNDLLDFIDKADQDVKPGGKALTPLTGSNILSPDDVLITGTGAIGQGVAGAIGDDSKDETSDDDKLSHKRKKYIVQEGDTIDSIAETELGDARFANLIFTINQANIASRLQDGKKVAIKLDPGQIIWLPSDHELQVHAEIYLLD